MISNFVLGGILGLLLGLAWCYWKQIRTAYENKDLISSGTDLYSSAQNFWGQLQKI